MAHFTAFEHGVFLNALRLLTAEEQAEAYAFIESIGISPGQFRPSDLSVSQLAVFSAILLDACSKRFMHEPTAVLNDNEWETLKTICLDAGGVFDIEDNCLISVGNLSKFKVNTYLLDCVVRALDPKHPRCEHGKERSRCREGCWCKGCFKPSVNCDC